MNVRILHINKDDEPEYFGNGFMISPLLVVTCVHVCVKPFDDILMFIEDRRDVIRGKLVLRDSTSDVAIIEIYESDRVKVGGVVNISDTDGDADCDASTVDIINLGDKVHCDTYDMDQKVQLNGSVVAVNARATNNADEFYTNMRSFPGISGSAVRNVDNKIIGVVQGAHLVEGVYKFDICIPMSYITQHLVPRIGKFHRPEVSFTFYDRQRLLKDNLVDTVSIYSSKCRLFKKGDIILEVNGRAVKYCSDLFHHLGYEDVAFSEFKIDRKGTILNVRVYHSKCEKLKKSKKGFRKIFNL